MHSSTHTVNGHAQLRPNPADRRRHKRKPVLWSARIEGRGGASECIILDLSLGGAKIRASGPQMPMHQLVTLVIDRFGAIHAEVAWSRMGHMGLRFTDSPEHVAQIVGNSLPL